MPKLQVSSKSGFNAGDSYNVKYISLDKIIVDPEFFSLFKQNEETINVICESILKDGFHKEQPVSLWGNTLVDGHQRYAGARKAGLVEIPYVEKNFDCREDALLYSFERQAVRRNLTDADILIAAKIIPDKKAKNGDGRSAEILAKRLGKSLATVNRARKVLKYASEKEVQSIMNGESSINKINRKIKQPKEIEFVVNEAQSLPARVSFLKGAVLLLIDSKEINAAEILINHYMEKNEKRGFYALLPERISAQLPELPLVSRDTN